MCKFKISIIIPSFNQGQFLERTLVSVISQAYKNVEIIVMDGGSTDNSVEIIKKYEKYISFWKSEKDNGQSAAINDGFRIATGDFVTWLNSDDILLPDTLDRVAIIVSKHPDVRFFMGNVVWMDKNETIIKAIKVERYSKYFASKGLFANGGPTCFFKKELLDEYGYLREDFHYMMDTELWNRWIHNGEKFYRIKDFCWGLRLHENAKMSGHNFSDSPLANKNHPSWIQKNKERQGIQEMYGLTTSKMYKVLYQLFKLMDTSFVSRLYSLSLINKSIDCVNK